MTVKEPYFTKITADLHLVKTIEKGLPFRFPLNNSALLFHVAFILLFANISWVSGLFNHSSDNIF